MPTQEELNAAQVELDIANDNYAQLANRYNQYQKLFQEYAKSSPAVQNRAANAMWRALEDFYQIQEKMRTAEDRIAVAQNAVNNYNNIIANQPQQTVSSQPIARRRTVVPNETIIQPEPKPLNNEPLEVINIDRARPLVNNPVFNKLNEQQYLYNYRRPQVNSSPAIITNSEWIYWTLSPAPAIPYEIQNVRNLRWNDYLQWLKDLENNYWYNVIWQRAYRNWNSYRTY